MSTQKRRAPAAPEKPSRVILDALPFDPSDAKLPRLQRLFGVQLERARKALEARPAVDAKGADALRGHCLYKANLRTPLFMLEGLSRVMLGIGGDEEVFEELLHDVKIIEDVLGEVDFWWVVLEKGTAWELPRSSSRTRGITTRSRAVGSWAGSKRAPGSITAISPRRET